MYDAKRNDPYKTYEDKKVQFDKFQAQNEQKKESSFEAPQQQPMPQRRQNLVHEASPRGPPRGHRTHNKLVTQVTQAAKIHL